MVHIFTNPRLHDLFWFLLSEEDPSYSVYVYRMERGEPVRPALWKGEPYPTLLEDIRDEHGGGDFQIMIRRGGTMVLSGSIGIAPQWETRSTR